MAEYVYPQDQTVPDGQNVLFMDSIPFREETPWAGTPLRWDIPETMELSRPCGTIWR